tara:strand:+ start:64 stop:321 length:258 start_codon:yes stop_codon:yes gene_type:complete
MLTLHSLDRDFDVTAITNKRIPIDVIRIGISYAVRNELATLPAVPNVAITENAIGPHEQAPADAPIIVPIILPPNFRVSLTIFTL